MLNKIKNSPWLQTAYQYIKENPGCCKKEIIMAFPTRPASIYGHSVPNDTYSYRNRRLNRLISLGLVENRPHPKHSGYSLYAK